MAAAQNTLYGSTLSPPRLAQVREAVTQYLDSTTQDQDSLWQLLCPAICEQLKVDSSVSGRVEELYQSMRTNAMLYSKGEKVIQTGLGAPTCPQLPQHLTHCLLVWPPAS